MNINVSSQLKKCLYKTRLGIVTFSAEVKDPSLSFWIEMNKLLIQIQQNYQLDTIAKNPSIASAREAYKKCGKDPNRYRPSADSLLRRVVKERGLYKVNNVVDILNYISIYSGISIGGYDINKISGSVLMDIGRETDEYFGIGRGLLNITGLPVLRDDKSVFGTPTSDSVRTMISDYSSETAFVFFDFGNRGQLKEVFNLTAKLLTQFTNASNINQFIVEF